MTAIVDPNGAPARLPRVATYTLTVMIPEEITAEEAENYLRTNIMLADALIDAVVQRVVTTGRLTPRKVEGLVGG